MSKLIMLDLHGTLTQPIGDNKYSTAPDDQELREGVDSVLQSYDSSGYDMAIATNGTAVRDGMKTLEFAKDELKFAMQLADIDVGMIAIDQHEAVFIFQDVRGEMVDQEFTLPSLNMLKPQSGMLKFIMFHMGYVSCNDIMYVGNKDTDKGAADAANVKFVWADEWRAMGEI